MAKEIGTANKGTSSGKTVGNRQNGAAITRNGGGTKVMK